MKKIISTLALVIFSVVSNAQQAKAVTITPMKAETVNKISSKEYNDQTAKKESYELTQKLGLGDNMVADLFPLFQYKQEVLTNPESTFERKQEFMIAFNEKLMKILGEKSFEKLRANSEFYERLITDPSQYKKKE